MKSSVPYVLTRLSITVLVAFIAYMGFAAAATPSLPLKVVHPDIPLAGRADRFDYESIDPKRQLLFIAHLGSSMVTVFNLKTNQVAANISGISSVHGVLAVPSLGEAFATATGANTLDVISNKTLRIIARAPAGIYPDGMTYDPRDHELFISDEQGKTETVVDTRTNKRIATIAMGGKVGNSHYDPNSHLVFADVQTRDDIVAMNPESFRIVHRYKLPPACRHDHGLLIVPASHLAFVACDGNARLLVLTMPAMRTLSVHRTGKDPDVLAFDAGLQRLYIASESGVVTVFHLEGNHLHLLGRFYLADEAHSIAVDPRTHEVYLPLQNIGGTAILRIMAPDGK